MNISNVNERELLQLKELQKFLNKVKGVMLIPKDSKHSANHYSLICLLLDAVTYGNFKEYKIDKIIIDQLDNKYPILSIKAEENSSVVGLSIIDKESGLILSLPDQPMSTALVEFLKATKYDDKIPLMLGLVNGNTATFDTNIKSNVLLVLDGYVFE